MLSGAGNGSFAPYDFEPNAERVRYLDARMRAQLHESVRYIVDQLGAHIPIVPEPVAAFLTELGRRAFPPLTYAIYSDLVLAIDRDDLPEARRLLDLLLAQRPHAGGLQVRALGDRANDENADRYVRYVDTDRELPVSLTPPRPESVHYSRVGINEAFALLDAEDPEISAEIRELLREIILCGDSGAPGKFTFDGASNFMLWGAILINAHNRKDKVGMVQMLAHESAHNLLFGLCPDQPLVNNDPEERYPSPLREDPRPLEGIYHATFVCARMHRAIHRLARSGGISSAQRTQVKKAMELNARAFAAGMKTLDQHADFTEPGRAIIESARAYMVSGGKSVARPSRSIVV